MRYVSLPSPLIFHDLFNTILDLYKRGIGSRQFSRLIFLVRDSNVNWNVNEMGVKKEEERKEKFLEDSRVLFFSFFFIIIKNLNRISEDGHRDGKFVWKEEVSMKIDDGGREKRWTTIKELLRFLRIDRCIFPSQFSLKNLRITY